MTETHLSCYARRDDGTQVFVLDGTLDVATAPQAANALDQYVREHGPNVIVDAARLNFLDSRGIGALLGAAKAARDAGGQLFLNNPTLPVQKLIEMCGLTSLFPRAEIAPKPAPAPKPGPALASQRAETATRPPARPMRRAA